MKTEKTSLPIFFIFVTLTHLIALTLDLKLITHISKALIIPSVAVFYIQNSKKINLPISFWIIVALGLSWLGDILLIFQGDNSLYFLLGLIAFLFSHLAYIISYHKYTDITTKQIISKVPILVVIGIVSYTLVLLYIILPTVAIDMTFPVTIYGIVLAFHAIFASGYGNQVTSQNKIIFIGVCLFVLSDSLLAINAFGTALPMAGLLIMSTYCLAQLLIAAGFLKITRKLVDSEQ
ncbi:lysoplasmalogenase [Marinigracilibium pacificum]|uniref:Lysoplasmalogenase n=1 Tax=Marinigracilibium pacificum TaxID=2729599 RepID=A0A848JC30_9BACT|nr:lysoplasmalogenase [Marinigracilibium pacificum]NMM50562.1 lysoplasmalogenase [Marinigracilibium pacificum]